MFKQNKHIQAFKAGQQGLSIVEALIAILIFSIGVLGIVGMQANMVQNTSESKNRVDASNIIQQQLGMMWADSTTMPNQGGFKDIIVSSIPGGKLRIDRGTSAAGTGTQLTLTLTWQEPGKDPHQLVTTAVIAGN